MSHFCSFISKMVSGYFLLLSCQLFECCLVGKTDIRFFMMKSYNFKVSEADMISMRERACEGAEASMA